MSRKNKKMKVEDPMFDLISISQKNAIEGIGPKNKKKQPSIFDVIGNNSLEITNSEISESKNLPDKKFLKSGISDWKNLPIKRAVSSMNKPVEDWHSEQFYIYFSRLYKEKYPLSNLETSTRAGITFMKKLLEDFKETLNREFNPEVIKKYLDWFIKNELDIFISQKGKFVLQDLRSKKAMRRFDNQHRIEESAIVVDEVVSVVPDNAFKRMTLIFKASRINFIMKYGVVISLYWLINEKSIKPDEAKDIIIAILKDTNKEGESSIEKVKIITSSFSPYPLTYNNNLLKDIFSFLKMEISDIQFSEKSKDIIFG